MQYKKRYTELYVLSSIFLYYHKYFRLDMQQIFVYNQDFLLGETSSLTNL